LTISSFGNLRKGPKSDSKAPDHLDDQNDLLVAMESGSASPPSSPESRESDDSTDTNSSVNGALQWNTPADSAVKKNKMHGTSASKPRRTGDARLNQPTRTELSGVAEEYGLQGSSPSPPSVDNWFSASVNSAGKAAFGKKEMEEHVIPLLINQHGNNSVSGLGRMNASMMSLAHDLGMSGGGHGGDGHGHDHGHGVLSITKYYDPPVPAAQGGDHHTDEVWADLFIDIVIVGACIEIGAAYSYSLDTFDVFLATFSIFSIFLSMWCTWWSLSVYLSGFNSNDLLRRFFYLVQILSLSMLALQSKGPADRVFGAVAASAVVSRLFLAIMYALTLISPHVGKQLHPHISIHVLQNLVSMLLYAAAAFLGTWSEMDSHSLSETKGLSDITLKVSLLMTAASVSEIAFNFIRSYCLRDEQKVPVSLHYIQTRLGMFIMIVLGESIIQLVANDAVKSYYNVGVYLSFVTTVFCMASIYFDNQPALPSQHAFNNGTLNGMLYIYVHPFLAFCILVFGVSIKRIPLSDDTEAVEYMALVSSAMGMALVFMNCIRATHAHGDITGVSCYASIRSLLCSFHLCYLFPSCVASHPPLSGIHS
jgi:low temperature requirement protein LtrA